MNNKLLIVIAAVIALAAYFAQKAAYNIAAQPAASNQHDVASGEPAIGGEFTLTDQNGATYTQENLKGHYSLVFFGFANCPDMCPMGLSNITNALDSMPQDDATHITPVFITVDPERDTPEKLKEYAANFHPRMVALTGSKAQTDAAASAFKVYHQIADTTVEDYTVNHSGFIYVINPQGKYVKHFAFNDSPETIAAEMQVLLH
jgi:protein SCO1/2